MALPSSAAEVAPKTVSELAKFSTNTLAVLVLAVVFGVLGYLFLDLVRDNMTVEVRQQSDLFRKISTHNEQVAGSITDVQTELVKLNASFDRIADAQEALLELQRRKAEQARRTVGRGVGQLEQQKSKSW